MFHESSKLCMTQSPQECTAETMLEQQFIDAARAWFVAAPPLGEIQARRLLYPFCPYFSQLVSNTGCFSVTAGIFTSFLQHSCSHLMQICSTTDAEALDIFAAFCPHGDAFLPFSSFYLLLLLLVARARGQLLTVLHRCRLAPRHFSF
jgi:hypothetical protein